MNRKDWQRLLDRDLGRCVHCGETEAISPNHRGNRGMGGSKALDKPSNLILLCSEMNTLIESSNRYAEQAKSFGWKISKWDTPENVAVFDYLDQKWFYLDNAWNRREIDENRQSI